MSEKGLETPDYVKDLISNSMTEQQSKKATKQGTDISPRNMKSTPSSNIIATSVKKRIDISSKFRAKYTLVNSVTSNNDSLLREQVTKSSENEIRLTVLVQELTDKVKMLSMDKDSLMQIIREMKQEQAFPEDIDLRLQQIQEEQQILQNSQQTEEIMLSLSEKDKLLHEREQEIQQLKDNIIDLEQQQSQEEFAVRKELSELQETYEAMQKLHEQDVSTIELQTEQMQTQEKMAEQRMLDMQVQLEALFKENSALNYTIQDLKGKIRIAVRVRPSEKQKLQLEFPDFSTYKKALQLSLEQKAVDGRMLLKTENYQFDRVFREVDYQDSVFDEYEPLIQQIFSGHKILLIAYGQSGSGKTYTMFGSKNQEGLMPKSISYIYQLLQTCQKNQPSISVSFYEIYNDKVFDLLSADLRSSSIEVQPRECKVQIINNQVIIQNLCEIPIQFQDELLDLVDITMKKRKTSATVLNDTSSRSHAVFTINLREIIDGNQVQGSLTLVDLAGSEEIQNSELDATRKQESIFINQSLSSLSNIFISLGQKKQFVNFRDSSLTSVLQEYFQGDSKAVMIVCLNEAADCSNENVNSLKFASRIKNVAIKK